ncbi:glutaminyl-peptide cyclotransferase [Corynebacterium propinquum]
MPKTTESAGPAAGEAAGRATAQAQSADHSVVSSAAMNSGDIEKLVPKVLATHPFSPESFTQGLEFDDDGSLLVGTGQWGQSRIYRANLADHSIAEHAELADEFFGEGITRSGDIIWQLTWQAGEAIARDPHTLAETNRVHYDGEGWGVCAREGELLVSDGSDTISKRDPVTFAPRAGEELRVTAAGTPVGKINELECVGDDVYANIFLSDEIIRFSAETGEVDAVIDASDLENNATADPNHVLNGIAFQESTGHFFVTGKRWPDLYEVEFVPTG